MPDDKVLLANPQFQFIYQGRPLAGGKVFLYDAGTTTKAESFTDASGLTPNTNPVVLDADGRGNFWVASMFPNPVTPNPPGPPGARGPAGPPGPPGSTGNAADFSNVIDIASEDVYGMHGNYTTLVPNDDPDTTIIPILIALNFRYQTTPYATNSGNFLVSWGPPIIPVTVPHGSFSDALLEGVANASLFMANEGSFYGMTIGELDCRGKPLTLTVDTALDGAPIIAVAIRAAGTGYAVSDTGTIDGGATLATYEILAETGGVPTSVQLTGGGKGYSSVTGATTTTGGGQPGTGTGLTLDTTSALTIGGTLRVTTWYRKQVHVPA